MPETKSEIISLGVADMKMGFACADRRLINHLRKRYGAFGTGGTPPHVLAVRVDETLNQSEPNNISVKLAPGRLHASSSSFNLEYAFRKGGGLGELRVDGRQLLIDVENALRIWIAHLAVRHEMILVHAAAVCDPDGKTACVFAGKSGAGKTTFARLAAQAGREVISDDLVLIRFDIEPVVVVPAPLGTIEFPPSKPVEPKPVSKLYFLQHARKNFLRPIAHPTAMIRLMAAVPFLPRESPEMFMGYFGAVGMLLGKVPVAVFGFLPNRSAIEFLEERESK